MFGTVRHIIFDLDGTLIDSSAGVVAATNYALVLVGEPPRSADEIKRFIGHPLDEMFPSFTDTPLDLLKFFFQEKARQTVVASARILPGVTDALTALRAGGYRMAIATTKFSHHTAGTVARFGWEKYFDALVSGDEVAHVKPAPDIIHLALKRLGATTDDTVMVGDTINDIKAAHGAGLAAIAVRSPFGMDDLERHNPRLILDDIKELKTIFRVS